MDLFGLEFISFDAIDNYTNFDLSNSTNLLILAINEK
jgi:hypothetical protein